MNAARRQETEAGVPEEQDRCQAFGSAPSCLRPRGHEGPHRDPWIGDWKDEDFPPATAPPTKAP